MANYAGLELGTTTVTGVLLNAERREILHLAQRPNDSALPTSHPTRAEQDPHLLSSLIEERFGLPVEVPQHREAAAVRAAMLAVLTDRGP
jgi:sugar (pentulose or hexulose) kinase